MIVIPFPEPEEDPEEVLVDAHIKLMDAVQHNQDQKMRVTVILDLEEALQIVQLIERSVDAEWFSDEPPTA